MIDRIKERHCPNCTAPAVEMGLRTDVDGKVLVHCNGQRWEWIKFACGMRIEWVPNFEDSEVKGECRNDEKVKTRREVYNTLLTQLIDLIEAAPIDQYSKDNLTGAIRWRIV